MIELHFREMAETDRNLVLSSWLRTFVHSAEVRHAYGERVFVDFETMKEKATCVRPLQPCEVP